MNSIKIRTEHKYFLTVYDREFKLEHKPEPAEYVVVKILPDGAAVVGYLVQDEDCNNPLEDNDEMGHIYSSSRHDREDHEKMQAALGLNTSWEPNLDLVNQEEVDRRFKMKHGDAAAESIGPGQEFELEDIALEIWKEGRRNRTIGDQDVVLLDCYNHGGQTWAISGSERARNFPDQQWDVGHSVGVWVPDDGLRVYLKEAPPEERHARAIIYCEQALSEYNAWLNGDCYGVCTAVFDKDNQPIGAEEACWGYIGREYAEKEREERIEYEVEKLGKSSPK